MEKVIYALWKDGNTSTEDFNEALLTDLGPKLCSHTYSVRLNLKDARVAEGTSPKAAATDPQMDALVQVWIDSANDMLRAPVDALVSTASNTFQAWLVSESVPLKNTLHPTGLGAPTHGFSQMVFLRRPDELPWEAWRDIWQNSHTSVAVDTQSNFEYRQNLITRRLTAETMPYDGIVEECFPEAALTDPLTYFDSPGDPEKMQANLKLMMESVARFIDHTKMDCMPTSQYDLKTFAL